MVLNLLKSKAREAFRTVSVGIRMLPHYRANRIFTDVSAEEKLVLLELARKCKGHNFVEIGSYLGASACFIAEALRGKRDGGVLYCVDTWKNDAMSEGVRDTFTEFCTNTGRYRTVVHPLRGCSADIGSRFNQAVDFLFVDGDHSYQGVKSDVDTWFPKLSSDAIVIFHDIGWAEGVQRVVFEEVSPIVREQGRLANLWWGIGIKT